MSLDRSTWQRLQPCVKVSLLSEMSPMVECAKTCRDAGALIICATCNSNECPEVFHWLCIFVICGMLMHYILFIKVYRYSLLFLFLCVLCMLAETTLKQILQVLFLTTCTRETGPSSIKQRLNVLCKLNANFF